MRRIKMLVLMAALCCIGLPSLFAQKYACVNTQYILSNVPDYAIAQQQIEKFSAEWQKELEGKIQEVDKMYKSYQQESYLLPDNLKRKREDEIVSKERELKELQMKRFGSGGDLDKKREELMKPIQDKVYNAIERIANEKGYAFILDKSGSATLLFVNAKYDISDQILDLLGYSSSAKGTGDADAAGGSKKVDNPEMKKPR